MLCSAVHRCFFSQTRIYFSDVVFADIFTSFAKVVGDVWLSICMLLPGGSLLLPPAQDGFARWILPTFMRYIHVLLIRRNRAHYRYSIPYAVRFRQCLVEYFMTNATKRPLYNAIKYATAFPVIYLSAAQRLVTTTPLETSNNYASIIWYSEHPLFVMWYAIMSTL